MAGMKVVWLVEQSAEPWVDWRAETLAVPLVDEWVVEMAEMRVGWMVEQMACRWVGWWVGTLARN